MKLFKNILHGEVLTLSGVASIVIYIVLRLDGKPFEVALIASILLGLIGGYCIGLAGAMIEDMSKCKHSKLHLKMIDDCYIACVCSKCGEIINPSMTSQEIHKFVKESGFYHQQLSRAKRGE